MREALVSINESDLASLGIDELHDLFQSAVLRDFEELACYGDGAVIRVETDSRVEEERLESLDYVDEWEYIAGADDTHQYVVVFTAPALSEDIVEQADALVGTCDPDVTRRGATMSLVGPQEAIAGTIGEYEREGVSPNLQRLGTYHGRREPFDQLTDRQQEVVQRAFEMGYYEVPREVSTSDVAAALEVDPSTVAEHLQRAERNLLRYHLETG